MKISFYRLVALVVILIFWMVLNRLFGEFWVSSPYMTALSLKDLFLGGGAISHVRITLLEAASGYIIGGIAGVAIAFFLSRFEDLARALDPFMMIVYGIPKITLAPLFILWFGIGIQSKIFLSLLVTFFILFFSTFSGIAGADIELKKVARVMGASDGQVERTVVLPETVPHIITGLKISLPYAITAAIVGEFIASNKGIGYLIMNASYSYDTSGVFAGIILIAAIIMGINSALNYIEGRLLRWRPKESGARPTDEKLLEELREV